MQIECLDSNFGFATANNIGARLARGMWLALLNMDAYPEPDWLEHLLLAAHDHPEYTFFASRQILANMPSLLDGAGDAYHVSGLAWRQCYNQPVDSCGLDTGEVFGACAAAALYRKNDFHAVGGFDETFFSYYEDVDLSFRLRLASGRCLYVSTAVVKHIGSASAGKTSDFVYYHVHRNLVWTFFKNMPSLLFWAFLPLHMALNTILALFYLLKEGRAIVIKAKLDALRALPTMVHNRKHAQQMRTATIRALYSVMNKKIFISSWPYLHARKQPR
jgi:GT2 family glycosyltransferase